MPVMVVVACAHSGGAASTSVDGPVLRYPEAQSRDEGMAAVVRGRLELDGACLYVALDEVDERYPIVWPAGTTWDGQQQAVVNPAGVAMSIGSDVFGTGGYLHIEDVKRSLGSDAERLASRCVDNAHGEIAFVNNAARCACGRPSSSPGTGANRDRAPTRGRASPHRWGCR